MSSSVIGAFLGGVAVGFVVGLAAVAWLVANASWRRANLAGVRVPLLGIVGMRLRGTPPDLIVDATVALHKRGHTTPWTRVEAAFLAHGDRRIDYLDLLAVVEREVAPTN